MPRRRGLQPWAQAALAAVGVLGLALAYELHWAWIVLFLGMLAAFVLIQQKPGARKAIRSAGARSDSSAARSATAIPKLSALTWLGPGERLVTASFELHDPLTYASEGPTRIAEASCIDLSAPVGRPIARPTKVLGYDPHYISLSPDQRATYLRWLAGGRSGPLDDIGYAVLFFYGLERRLLIDRQDLRPIIQEVVRLLETYTSSGSLDGYLSRFLAYSLARAGVGTLNEKWCEAVFASTRGAVDEQYLAVGLAWFLSGNRPLPASWALRIARLDPRSTRSVVLDRLPDQFQALFARRYQEKFGEGLALRAAKRDRNVTYTPASPSLIDTLPPVKIPNVLGIQSQFAPLVEIWTACVEELRPLSRVVSKGEGVDVRTRAAYEALPEALKAGVEHPDKPRWDRLVSEHAREDGVVLLEVARLAEIHGIEERPKLTAKQSESLAETAHHVGFEIEPDPRVTRRPYGWDDLVALLRPEATPSLPRDARFTGASVMLELGMYVAAADGAVDDEEVDHVARFLESQFQLDPPDARRLEALKRVLMSRPPSIAGAGKRLQAALKPEQRESVGQFLVGVAASNGVVDKKEITALRNAYKALGIDVAVLNRLIEDMRRASKEPVEIARGPEVPAPGEPIPQAETAIALNEDLLRKIMSETRDVARMLGEAMRDVEPEPEPPPLPTPKAEAPPPPAADPRFEGLDLRYHAALAELLARPNWPTDEFEALARRHKLMPSGALDRINEWAQERLGDDVLVEQGDELIIGTNLIAISP